ncbi:MAG: hypothetical protein AAGJ19_00015 [Myxococcota bacterium]
MNKYLAICGLALTSACGSGEYEEYCQRADDCGSPISSTVSDAAECSDGIADFLEMTVGDREACVSTAESITTCDQFAQLAETDLPTECIILFPESNR